MDVSGRAGRGSEEMKRAAQVGRPSHHTPLRIVSRDDTYHSMIQSTKGDLIQQVLAGRPGKGFPADVFRPAVRKVAMLEAAAKLNDLRSPPGNRLEALSSDREGQHSIRINDQWRICFIWTDSGPENVEIVDYH